MSTSVQTLRQDAARQIGALLAMGTATSGNTSMLVDASTSDSGIIQSALSNGVERFKGGYLLMTGGTAGNIGLWREISDDAPGTGTITPAKAFPNSIQAGDTYEIYAALDPSMWNKAINAGLKRCQYVTKSPITLVTDGDMEATGTTSWAATNATVAKSTSDTVSDGAQSLVVTNTSLGGYVTQATSIPVTPGRSFRMWVDYRVVSSGNETAQIAVYDATHATFIQAAISPDQDAGKNTQGGMMQLAFSIPVGCVRAQIRLIGSEATAVIAWDDLILVCTSQFRYSLPSWLTSRQQYATLVNRTGSSPLEYEYPDVGWPLNLEEDATALVAFRCNLPREALSRPVFLEGERAYGPIANIADASTFACDDEWALWETASAAHEFFGQALSQASLARERDDAAHCEVRVNELRSIFMAYKKPRLGFSKRWVGARPISMP